MKVENLSKENRLALEFKHPNAKFVFDPGESHWFPNSPEFEAVTFAEEITPGKRA